MSRPGREVSCGIAILTGALLLGCSGSNYGTVTVEYRLPESTSQNPIVEKSVRAAFDRYANAHGYKCWPKPKRVQEATCRGKDDAFIEFEPQLGRAVSVTSFTLVSSLPEHRSRFRAEVLGLAAAMQVVPGVTSVSVEDLPKR